MTLLHQAAQKAVEAMKDATRGYDAMNWNRSKLDAAITAIESALQHQEVPREPVATLRVCVKSPIWTRKAGAPMTLARLRERPARRCWGKEPQQR